MRSKGFIGVVLIALLVLAAGCTGCQIRNSLTSQQELVTRSWADVQAQYQRRANLIPNLVSTVRRAESFDREVIESVAAAERAVRDASGDDLSAASMRGYLSAQRELGSSLGRLLDESRQSQQLASVEAFQSLQDQLEGTENRIAVAHRDYNKAVAGYNSRIRKFPTNIVAALTGFHAITPFEAEAGAERAPDVDL
ncbi:MAG: LemA family protein [Rhodothermales bacterium]|nr:LemA family protein [Rhodothermales bacterium]